MATLTFGSIEEYGRECKQKKENLHQQRVQLYVIYYCEKNVFFCVARIKKKQKKEVEKKKLASVGF